MYEKTQTDLGDRAVIFFRKPIEDRVTGEGVFAASAKRAPRHRNDIVRFAECDGSFLRIARMQFELIDNRSDAESGSYTDLHSPSAAVQERQPEPFSHSHNPSHRSTILSQ